MAVDWSQASFSYDFADRAERNTDDSAPHAMKAVVINPYFDWQDDRPPRRPYHETVLYEAHVRGLTMTHPGVPEEIRGTYAALAHPVVIDYLTDLGVAAVELMPVHQFVQDWHLVERGLASYWGYNTIGFFTPHDACSSAGQRGQQVQEFKAMVRERHRADIEVILDVVSNHTAEGTHLGPTLDSVGVAGLAPRLAWDDGPTLELADLALPGRSAVVLGPAVLGPAVLGPGVLATTDAPGRGRPATGRPSGSTDRA